MPPGPVPNSLIRGEQPVFQYQARGGRLLLGGGFLGLDNISPIDRSSLPPGVRLAQADGTAWMAFYSLSMLVLAARLAQDDPVYDDMVVKFAEQYLLITDAIDDSGMYDAADGWFYDQLSDASGRKTPIKVQTLVGAIPVLPAVTLPASQVGALERLRHRFVPPVRITQILLHPHRGIHAIGHSRDQLHRRTDAAVTGTMALVIRSLGIETQAGKAQQLAEDWWHERHAAVEARVAG